MRVDEEFLNCLETHAKAAKKGKRSKEWAWEGRRVDSDGYVHIPQGSTLVGLVHLGDTYEGCQADCDFMQAANPWVVLALVNRVRELTSVVRDLEQRLATETQWGPKHD